MTYIGLREDAVAVAKTDFIFISTGKFSVSGRLLFFQSLKCADRNLFRTRVVKSSPLVIFDHGEGFAVFVRMISQRVANGQRSTFHNRELRAWEIDCLVNIEVTGAITGGAFITYCQERHEPRTLAMLYRYAGTLPCKMMGLRIRVPAAAGSAGHEYINAHGFDVYRDGESRVVFSADGGRASHLLMLAVQAAAGSLQF